MREKGSTTQKHVRFTPSELLKTLQESLVDFLGSKVVDEVVVINGNLETRAKKDAKED